MASSVERYCFFCNRKEQFSSGGTCTGCGSSQKANKAAIQKDKTITTRLVHHACDHCTSVWAMKESDECLSCMGCSTKSYRIKQVMIDKTRCAKCENKLFPGVATCAFCGHGEESVEDE